LKRFNAVLDARYRRVLDLLREAPPGRGVDLGCGDGCLTARLARLGHQVVGLESEREALEWARLLSARDGRLRLPSWVRASAEQIPLRDRSCDWALLGEVIEHLDQPAGLLREVARILRPGGWIVVTTPRRIRDHAWDPEHHVRELDGEELALLMGEVFEDVRVEGLVPMRLFRAYRLNRRWRTPVRVCVNACAVLGWNLFRRGVQGPPGEDYGQLIAVGRRPVSSC
jgi:SAM-dependent methyltransferase